MSDELHYRTLLEGEIVEATDEILDDRKGWVNPGPSVGHPAPNPDYGAHRLFRRRVSNDGTAEWRECRSLSCRGHKDYGHGLPTLVPVGFTGPILCEVCFHGRSTHS